MIEISARGATDVGKVRKSNEDAIGVDEARGIFILADGMGGHESGARASKAAVETLHQELLAVRSVFERCRTDASEGASAEAVAAVVAAFEKTCARVYDLGREGQTRRRMGSTLDALIHLGDRALLAHVGDGRVYLSRGGRCNRLTEDHSIVAEQVRAGVLTPAEAETSRFRGVLTRAIGTHRSVKVDTLMVDINAGDLFVMCSDGLHRYAHGPELAQLLGQNATPAAAARLIEHANVAGGEDNVSVILVGCREAASTQKMAAAGSTTPLGDSSTTRVASRIDAICKLPLFQHLSYREQVAVLALAKSRVYEPAATVITQGEAGSEMFVIIDGSVMVERDGAKLAELGAGGHFGEMALVDDARRSATVTALTRTDVLSIGEAELSALMRVEPVVGVKILWNFAQVLSRRLRTASAEIAELQMNQVPGPTTLAVPFGD